MPDNFFGCLRGRKWEFFPHKVAISYIIWFEWTTYGFNAGSTHTQATAFPHLACVLISEWTRLATWKWASRHKCWTTLSLGGLFKERFNLERFSTWPTELHCLWVWPWVRLSFTALQIKPRCQWNRKWHLYLVSPIIRAITTIQCPFSQVPFPRVYF